MEKVHIAVSQAYDVLIGRDLLAQAKQLLTPYVLNRKVLVVSDHNVEAAGYVSKLTEQLTSNVEQVTIEVLPAGEAQKSMANVTRLLSRLAELNFSRTDYLIALGGGVIGDLVGFVAGIYLRGVDFIQIPTTLLSAIDSSVGGKTAVDLPEGKNLAGVFHQPRLVLCDVSLFESLPSVVFEDGCSELIKYGMIMDPILLKGLLERPAALKANDGDLVEIVKTCVELKASVVLEDEFDLGMRQLLNYGHTLGHALEQVSGYRVSHGRAVATGMLVFLKIAVRQGGLAPEAVEEFSRLLHTYHLLPRRYDYSTELLQAAMLKDKKRRSQTITIVLPSEFGRCELKELPIEIFMNVFEKEWVAYGQATS